MAIGDIIVGLDIGVSKISCVIGQVNKFSEIEVIGYGLSNNSGIKRGQILDYERVGQSIKDAVNSAEQISDWEGCYGIWGRKTKWWNDS